MMSGIQIPVVESNVYSSTVLKYNFEVFYLSNSILEEANIVLFTTQDLFQSFSN